VQGMSCKRSMPHLCRGRRRINILTLAGWRGPSPELRESSQHPHTNLRGPFEKFVDWRQCAAVMQREAVTTMPGCSGGGNVVA
jgi:hypothetical protein